MIDLRPTPPVGLGERPAASLSPSRAGDFLTCPLMYRFRTIDRLPEPPSAAAARGTVIHAVLERLFDHPAPHRTAQTAVQLLPAAWDAVVAQEPHLPGLLFGGPDAWDRWLATQETAPVDPTAVAGFLTDAEAYVHKYFGLEDPTRLEPAEREVSVSTQLPSGLVLRGIIDRIDRAPSGAIRVVDYKTGRSPGEGWEAKALFQMRFYGLILWRLHGQIPARLQLLYLGNQERLAIDPTDAELRATEAKLEALWAAIARVTASGDWQPNRSRLCDWCSFQSLCPEFGGTPPALPDTHTTATVLT